ncbi:glycosyltransferase family 2 protein [Priestia megaterium]|uniref:glycosyltransferase family 2 protein n=1 Tax=Priestia megaterium TaxID=1404 RepID=UPI00221E8E26|nr:glycosyltransferase family 2 protein [Priestia megaterium]
MVSVSVIMPVYNSEKYVYDAVESILKQSFEDFELIIVNDGSTDNSQQICEELAKKDSRVKLITQQNAGISEARNTALRVAKGEYIAFADNDDFFKKDLLKENIYLAKKHNADVVKFGVSYYSVNETETKKVNLRNIDFKVLDQKEIFSSYRLLKDENLLVYVWDSLFKRSLIERNKISFSSQFKYGGEDINFNLKLLPHIKKLVVNPQEYYEHYKRQSHSTVVKFNANKLDSYTINAELEYRTLESMFSNDRLLRNNWLESLSLYLIQISIALANLKEKSLHDKVTHLRSLTNIAGFNMKINFSDVTYLINHNKKRGLVILFYKLNLFRLIQLSIEKQLPE